MVRKQVELINSLSELAKAVKALRYQRSKKIEFVRSALGEPKYADFSPVAFPLDPSIVVCGIKAGEKQDH
jgi:hypothetical protein